MASTDAKPIPVKNAALRITFAIYDNTGSLVTGATGLDSEVSKDGGTFADCTNEATEIATSSGIYYLDLTSTEMNADTVAIQVKTSTANAKTSVFIIYPYEAGDTNTFADDLLKRDMSAVSGESARSPLNAMRILRNKVDAVNGIVYKEDDSTSAWTFATTSVAAGSANVITVIDPA
jgi:hypothetical protein